jgi:hypothetical protein
MKSKNEIREIKSKLYDYEIYYKKIGHFYETKNFDLAEAAKDFIDMKKRIINLNNLNQNLQRENECMKLAYHNLYVNINKIQIR